ncbi:Orange carotenoid protein [Kovacikia minuta CCNUW1]|uniref:orange carotenoid protein N-terminal domain-containing protein n=1 Tax=Kovacikia minuta TaxID=2931930 RepID=UPI001CC9A997|nr:orange carotenoid protein N-terminal domain-containing protein [Kovacikia minuta]UBF27500.1 Orange carotenoid protein [Kovacikia minuta CCNUW1]
MTYTVDKTTQEALNAFKQFDVDTQLALLWFGYLDIKDQLQPAPPNSVAEPANAVFDQIKALPQEQQLQAQRDIANCANTPVSRAYGAQSANGKLQVWLSLAQGMEEGTIINLPEGYQLPSETNNFVNQVKGLSFEQRINFSLSAVEAMGATVR